MEQIHFQLSIWSVDLNVLQLLTNHFDFNTGSGFTSLILQDYLVVASVLPLCDLNCQACVVAICFRSNTMTRLKNHLETSSQGKNGRLVSKSNKRPGEKRIGKFVSILVSVFLMLTVNRQRFKILKGLNLTLSPFIHTTLGAGSPLMGISSRSLFPATIVTVLSGKFKLSKCTFGGSVENIINMLLL